MANQKYNRGPKRRIEKVYCQIEQTVATSVQDIVLHTCEDRKTLVRAIFEGHVLHITGNPGSITFGFNRAPNGQTIWAPAVAQLLDQDMPDDLLWVRQVPYEDASQPVPITVDSKGMRKLSPGDTLQLTHIGDVAAGAMLVGTITLFFKE